MSDDFFYNFKAVTGKNLPNPQNLTVDEKAALAHHLLMSGESKVAIAKFLGVSRQQVYNLLKKADEQRLSELECQTYLSNFVKVLHELEATRDIHRNRVTAILKIIENGWIDPETGEKREKTGLNRDLSEAARIVRDYDKLIIDLQMKVGIIPVNSQNPYESLKDRAPKTENTDNQELQDKTPDELVGLLLHKLMNRPTSSLLKSVKDENIL